MPRIFEEETIVIQVSGGGGGPNPTDDFSLKINFADTNATPTDATSFAFAFPDTIPSLSDAVRLGLSFADTNPTISDSLLRLGINMADTNAAPTDNLSLAISFSDTNVAPTDTVSIALTLADTNPVLTDNMPTLNIRIGDTNAAPTDNSTFVINLAQADTIPANTDALTNLRISGYNDSNTAPTEARTSLAHFWLSGSTGTSNVTNPANANGPNNGVNSSQTTIALGATTSTLTSNVGNGIPASTPINTAIYRGWFRYTETLGTSSGQINAVGSFGTVSMLAITANTDHLTGTFTFDLIAAGINTLAELQSMTVTHSTTDAAAGVTPAIMLVDAGRIELTNVI